VYRGGDERAKTNAGRLMGFRPTYYYKWISSIRKSAELGFENKGLLKKARMSLLLLEEDWTRDSNAVLRVYSWKASSSLDADFPSLLLSRVRQRSRDQDKQSLTLIR